MGNLSTRFGPTLTLSPRGEGIKEMPFIPVQSRGHSGNLRKYEILRRLAPQNDKQSTGFQQLYPSNIKANMVHCALIYPKDLLSARMLHELQSRDREDGRATWLTQGVGPEAYLNGTSQGAAPEDARKDGHTRGRSR